MVVWLCGCENGRPRPRHHHLITPSPLLPPASSSWLTPNLRIQDQPNGVAENRRITASSSISGSMLESTNRSRTELPPADLASSAGPGDGAASRVEAECEVVQHETRSVSAGSAEIKGSCDRTHSRARSPVVEIVLDDSSVSRRHAESASGMRRGRSATRKHQRDLRQWRAISGGDQPPGRDILQFGRS